MAQPAPAPAREAELHENQREAAEQLHAQAFGFTALLPAAITDSDTLAWAGIAAFAVHLWLALRRVYGGTRRGTALRLAAFAAGYVLAVGLGLGVAGLVAVYRV